MEALEGAIKALANKLPGLDAGKAASGFQVEKFRGRDDPRTLRAFLREFYLHANAAGLDDSKRCKVLPLLLTGDILVVYGQLGDDVKSDWKKLTKALKEYLDMAGDMDLTRQRLARRKQGNSESVYVFSQEISDLVKRAYPKDRNFSDDMRDELALQAFLGGLLPSLKQHVMRANPFPTTLTAAVKEASREEALQREIQRDVTSLETVNLVKDLAERVERMELDGTKQEEVHFTQDRGFRGTRFSDNRGRGQRHWQNSGDSRGYGNRGGYGNPRGNYSSGYGNYNNGNYASGYGNYGGNNNNYRGSSSNYRGSSGNYGGSYGNYGGGSGNNGSYGNGYGTGYSQGNSYGNGFGGYNAGRVGQQQYGNSNGRGSGRGRRSRGRGGYSISAVMTQPLTLLSICLALFSLVGPASAVLRDYQICSDTRGGHLIERPSRQACDVPDMDQAIMAQVDIYVKRTAPVLSTAYFCYNVTEIVCAKSYLGIARDVIRLSPIHTNVSSALCWDLVRNHAYQNQTLEATGEFRWETRNLARAQYPILGSRCTSTSNLVVLRGTVGSVDGRTLISGLDHLAGCQFSDLSCTRLHGITVWESLPNSSFCPYADSASSSAILSHNDVLIRDMQARFSYTNQSVPAAFKSCLSLSESLFLLENEVVVHVQSEIKASTPASRNRGQRSPRDDGTLGDRDALAKPTSKQLIQPNPYPRVFVIPPNRVLRVPLLRWLDAQDTPDATTPAGPPKQFKVIPLRGRNGITFDAYLDIGSNQLYEQPLLYSLVQLLNGSVVRTVSVDAAAPAKPVFAPYVPPTLFQRYRVFMWRCPTTKHLTPLYYQDGSQDFEPYMDFIPPPGTLLTYDDGTSEIATESTQRYDCFEPYEELPTNNTRPLFLPPHRHHNPDWPFVKPRSVLHRQRLSEEYETEVADILIDYFETLYGREFDHPADLPHGSVITYANRTQLYIFWQNGSFEMLRHNVFQLKERSRLEQRHAATVRAKRSVDGVQLLDNDADERARAEAVLRAFKEAEKAEAAEAARLAALEASAATRRQTQHRTTKQPKHHAPTRRHTSATTRRSTTRRRPSKPARRPTTTTKSTTTTRRLPTTVKGQPPTTPRHTPRLTHPTTVKTLTRAATTPLPTMPHHRLIRSTVSEDTSRQPPASAGNQAPSTSQREQIVNFVNSRLQYATHQVRDETRKEYATLWKLTCGLHNRHIDIINAIASHDPTTGMRLYLQREDVIAKHVGEVLSVSSCAPVTVDEIYWNQTVNGRCYELIPVRVHNVTLFIRSGSRDLLPRSRTIPCSQRNLNVYRNNNGTWSTTYGSTHVSSLTRHLMFNIDSSNLDIHAPSLFQSDLAQVTTSLSMMTQYAQRINTPRTRVPAIPSDTPPALDDLLRDIGATVEALATNATTEINSWFDNAIDKAGEIFNQWQHTLFAFLIVVLIIGTLAASLYTYPWWSQFIPRRQRHAVNAVTLNHHPVNAILVEDYYPDSDHIRFATLQDFPACTIPVSINGLHATALCDSGSNTSYITRDFASSLGLKIRDYQLAGRALDFSPMHFTGRAYAKLDILTAEVPTELLIVDNNFLQPRLVLGTDTFACAELIYGSIIFNLIKGFVRFGPHTIPFVVYDTGCGIHWPTGCTRTRSASTDNFAKALHVSGTNSSREVLLTEDGSAVIMVRQEPQLPPWRPTRRPVTSPTTQSQKETTTTGNERFPVGRHPILKIDVKDDQLRGMLDSGAGFSMISEYNARKLGLDFEDVFVPQARLANGDLISFKHRVLLQFSINCTAVTIYAFVTPTLDFANVPVILGVDAFRCINMIADIRFSFALKTIDIGGRMSIMEDHFTSHTTPLCCQVLSVPSLPVPEIRRRRVHQPYIRAKLGDLSVRALFDSGSSVTFCGYTTACQAACVISSAHRPSAITANGSEMHFIGSTIANVQVGGCTVPMEVFVTSDEYAPAELIIGTDAMAAINNMDNTISLDWLTNSVRIGHTDVPMINAVLLGNTDEPKVRVRVDETIKARSEAVILVKIDFDLDPNADYIVEESDHRYDVQVGRSFVRPGTSRRFPIRLVNHTNSDVKLYRNSVVATLQQAEHVRLVYDPAQDTSDAKQDDNNPHYIPKEADWTRKQPTADRREAIRQQLRTKLDLRRCCLTPAGQQQLRRIIEKHPQVFEGTVGRFRGKVQHFIHLIPNATPVRAKAYRTPINLTPEVERQLKELLDLKIIQPSTSPFASPIVLVRKKNGKYRFATDYRALNKITVPTYCPMSNISEILDLIGGSKIFTTVDLQSGFWQIPYFL
ncbi:hypothetical protein AAVH_12775 [Aphelenchoides avenae]|nr:hypothetical protein AAVH_12775 [Aphelenchus avenae]